MVESRDFCWVKEREIECIENEIYLYIYMYIYLRELIYLAKTNLIIDKPTTAAVCL